MSDPSTTNPHVGVKTSHWVTLILFGAAAVALVFGCSLALRVGDTEPLESPLLLSVARQLVRGPRELYGPFGRMNPLVIIHAPLYYRFAALLAWPLYAAGFTPVTAALVSGRALSVVGLGWTMAMAYRLARFNGRPARVGWWAALLIAASPAVGVMPYTVRPDMLGIAIQTSGVFLVLSALQSGRSGRITLAAAFAAFGLALCVKQQFVAAPVMSALLVITAWLRGRVTSNQLAGALLLCAAIVLVVYVTEELVTRGEMSHSVFRAAFAVGRVHPADWFRSAVVLYAIFGRSTGLVALFLAAALVSVGIRRGKASSALVIMGTTLLGLITLGALLSALSLVVTRHDLLFTSACLAGAGVLVVPACCLVAPEVLLADRIDRLLWIYLAAELALVALLSRMSTGAWVNYGIQAVVFGSVLIARALGQALRQARSPRQVFPIPLAAAVVLIGVSGDVRTTTDRRFYEQAALDRLFDHLGQPATKRFFFAGRPGYNRVHGRLDLVYDDWLYPVFESIHQAEPRSSWLLHALRSESVGFVVTTSNSPAIDGLGETLPRLGYASDFKVGPFYVWKHFRLIEAGPSK